MDNSLLIAERSKNMIEVLFSIIRPKPFDVHSKLIFNHVEKIWENITDIRLVFE
jgi:hypothetical protein